MTTRRRAQTRRNRYTGNLSTRKLRNTRRVARRLQHNIENNSPSNSNMSTNTVSNNAMTNNNANDVSNNAMSTNTASNNDKIPSNLIPPLQDYFDRLIQFFLESVSADDTLESLGITKKTVDNWDAFKNKIEHQGIYSKTVGKRKLYNIPLPNSFAGIYVKPVRDRMGSVHYYGVRKEADGTFTIGNGYPTTTGITKYAVGLNVQKDHSHGLCQTYALMYYFAQESKLKRGEEFYRENVDIGLNWLQNSFLKLKRKFANSKVTMPVGNTTFYVKGNEEIEEIADAICKLTRRCDIDDFTLYDLINIITNKGNKRYVDAWFYNYKPESDV